jgi:hypothetical protein
MADLSVGAIFRFFRIRRAFCAGIFCGRCYFLNAVFPLEIPPEKRIPNNVSAESRFFQ